MQTTPNLQARLTGTVKWFNDAKGFGFVTGARDGTDYFVHHGDIVSDGYRTLNEGDQVTFQVETTPKGLRARKVQPAGGAA
jgi:CspA family cold shock protein